MKNKILSFLFTPFNHIAGKKALIWGGLFLLLGSASAHIGNARYDGAIDLHFVETSTAMDAFFDQIINILALTTSFYVAARLSAAHNTRLIDIAGTMLLAKAPYTIMPLLNINGFMYNTSMSILDGEQPSNSDITSIIIISLPIIIFSIWSIALMVNAYKVSTNLKGNRMIIGFIAALISAEVVSKLLIQNTYLSS